MKAESQVFPLLEQEGLGCCIPTQALASACCPSQGLFLEALSLNKYALGVGEWELFIHKLE